MKASVLISCMYQNDMSIIENNNVQTDVVVINQCDENKTVIFQFTNKKGIQCNAKFISTTERGLSKSRNMAIANTSADICLICDDDEVLEDNYEEILINSFSQYPDKSIIAFKLNYGNKKFPDTIYEIGRFTSARINSCQIAFRLKDILESKIRFDEKMGSGTGNGGGEENRFLFQLFSKGLKGIYIPQLIATIKDNCTSNWFKGYTQKYFRDKGWASRRIFGSFYGYLYIWVNIIRHYRLYKNSLPLFKIIYCMHRGYIEIR